MKSLNHVQLIGRLGADPEIKNLSEGGKLCNLSIATDYVYKSKSGEKVEQTDWHKVTIFGLLCDHVAKYCRKGESIYVSGRLHTRDYTDKEGNKKYITEILAESVIFLSAKKVSEKAPEMEQVHTGGDAPPPQQFQDDPAF